MKLEHEFTVPAPVDEAWQVLLDVERVAPCMPGATLLSVDGDEFTGTVKVKVGPIQVTYKGKATFVERDEAAHRAVIEASGKEARGSGTAAATVHTVLVDAGGATTTVKVETDLNVTGRPAQFGRGVMEEVGAKLVRQFAERLAAELAGGPATVPEPVTEPAAEPVTEPVTEPVAERTGPRAVPPPARPTEPIDLLEVAGGSVAKRLAPVAAVLAVLLLLLWRRRRR
jgi:carbon monoxide dehydrogenase subunit G